MSNISLNIGNGYTLSIIASGAGFVEVALLHGGNESVNTGLWYYDHHADFYGDVVNYMNADQLINALVKAKAYAKGE